MPQEPEPRELLASLSRLDPELAGTIQEALQKHQPSVSPASLAMLVDDAAWGLSREVSFGRAIADGYLKLFRFGDRDLLVRYRDLVRSAGDRGTTVGRLMADHLVPVLACRDQAMLALFLRAASVMEAKGTYTMKQPLAALSQLLEAGDRRSAVVYLELLAAAFDTESTYNQCQHLAQNLPKAALLFAPPGRPWQLEQLLRIVKSDVRLSTAFLEGMDKGLQLLSRSALERFVSLALEKARGEARSAEAFLSLGSHQGEQAFRGLRVAVSLREMRGRLNGYLRARTGLPLSVRPLSELGAAWTQGKSSDIAVFSDRTFIYLPPEVARFGCLGDNMELYRCLVRFESGHHEFGSFDFDLDRFLDHSRPDDGDPLSLGGPEGRRSADPPAGPFSDLERFFKMFPEPKIAADLFTVFEHGRIRCCLAGRYPGLVRKCLPILLTGDPQTGGLWAALYAAVALGQTVPADCTGTDGRQQLVRRITARFADVAAKPDSGVYSSVELVVRYYRDVAADLAEALSKRPAQSGYSRLQTPYNRCLRPDLVYAHDAQTEHRALVLKDRLAEKGIKVYRSDLRRYLLALQSGDGSADLPKLSNPVPNGTEADHRRHQVLAGELADLLSAELSVMLGAPPADDDDGSFPVSWYREWDARLGDYLNDHTRVRDRIVEGLQGPFYRKVLDRHRGLVKQIRRSFELLRPEGLKIYRQWIEGDEFDYRALLDFVLDQKAGRTPSDRLYIKRLKEDRDVAVLLLVDLSRSTANTIDGSDTRVLDVEKEAIVLFSQALEVVGDAYAIAGFSGTGRLGVDYFRIKDFGEPLDRQVRQRINAMAPQRNTRMGAAIRHAASQFAAVSSRVRLLVLLGDGFPNDMDYKKEYAIEDTRRAIAELRSRQIHVHAITVNMAAADDSRLDDLYGEIHHNVITQVTELPAKLWRIYGTLTR